MTSSKATLSIFSDLNKKMNAIFLNAQTSKVEQIDIKNSNQEIKKVLNCKSFSCIYFQEFTLIVDDEGYLKGGSVHNVRTRKNNITHELKTIAGHALFVGPVKNEDITALPRKFSLDIIQTFVEFAGTLSAI